MKFRLNPSSFSCKIEMNLPLWKYWGKRSRAVFNTWWMPQTRGCSCRKTNKTEDGLKIYIFFYKMFQINFFKKWSDAMRNSKNAILCHAHAERNRSFTEVTLIANNALLSILDSVSLKSVPAILFIFIFLSVDGSLLNRLYYCLMGHSPHFVNHLPRWIWEGN